MALDYTRIKHWPIPEQVHPFSTRDTLLYALGVGAATTNPVADEDLCFVFEQGLKALPTLPAILGDGPNWMADPATGIDINKVLHGEQFLTLHQPLPTSGTVVGRTRIEEIYDKGADKGAVIYLTRTLHEQSSGTLLATVGYTVFLRGNGGFGGSAQGAPVPHAVPTDRPADLSLDLITRPEQAVLYRLSGDANPLHIDPRLSRQAGFDRPILHGLCSYGIAGRAVLKLLCGNDPARLRRFDLRFATPVFPGETLRTEVWRQGPGRAAFRVKVVERDVVVLNNGLVEYTE
ncbi:maoC-like dehydratase [Pseudomonas sp. M47T1]|uniref:MaoC/PaaZ C-terminal domain-containing protein n=1 Tax=Pseudomonas TaxID=286 RepID=UPI0002608089|nr:MULTISPECIES: MaoC/PaaZ C-terminal domain-containing protein [Pseudomonas]EIK93744.1 maoC-like dehydratase [Pseudomonas sp. M47T1]